MIKIENVVLPSPQQWKAVIRGMRNPMNSWNISDSYVTHIEDAETKQTADFEFFMGDMDHGLANVLAMGGSTHAKYRRMIPVYLDITAPLYWWKEFDTYKVGTVANSCSTMHKIHSKELTMEDFSCERLIDSVPEEVFDHEIPYGVTAWSEDDTGCLAITCRGNYHEGHSYEDTLFISQKDILDMFIIPALNANRAAYLKTKDKKYWDQMIQLLPTSYNQRRTVMLNYEVLVGIYKDRKNHKLEEWRTFCEWIETLPYSELITVKTVNTEDEK